MDATDRELVLTIDAGGSSVKATVLSSASGRLLGRSRRCYRPIFRRPGCVEFDPASWWAVIVAACREAVELAGAPPARYAGVTCTGMRGPFVLVDAAGEPLDAGVLVADRRGAPLLAEIERSIGRRDLYERTGHWLSSRFGLPKVLWFLRQAPGVFARTRHVLQLHDWLISRLSGVTISEPSSASMSQMLDVRGRSWATELLATLGIPESLLPPLVDAGAFVGGLLPGTASEVGLLAGTPVHAGGGDTHMGAFGADAARLGTIAVVGGSTTPVQLTGNEDSSVGDGAPLVSAHLRPGLLASETNAGETGVMYQWLCDTLTPTGDLETLERMAEQAPVGADGILITAAQPRWGESAWSRMAPITFFGVGPEHTVGHLARAAIECATYATAAAIEALVDRDQRSARVRALGGASHSNAWAQTLADVLDREVEVADLPDPAARAGALLVCPGCDIVVDDGVPTRSFLPVPARHARYAEFAQRFREVSARLDAAFGEPA